MSSTEETPSLLPITNFQLCMKWGMILGLVYIAIHAFFYFTGLMFTMGGSLLRPLMTTATMVTILIYGGIDLQKADKGVLVSFLKYIRHFFYIAFFGALFVGAYMVIFENLIESNIDQHILESSKSNIESMVEQNDLPEELFESQIDRLDDLIELNKEMPRGVIDIISKGILNMCVFASFLGLIIAFFMRRKQKKRIEIIDEA